VTVTLGLDGSGKVDIVAGGYEDWVKRRADAPSRKKKEASAEAPPKPASANARSKLSYKDQRDLDRLPDEVARIDGELMAVEELLHDPDLYARDPARFASLSERATVLRAEKDAAEERWLEVAALAEELSG